MALSANTVWEVRTGGADTNGGGFVTGASGTDWSQQNSAQYSVTDGVTAGSTTITSATASFGTDVVGNLIYVQGGTGSVTAGWYQITARTNATTITVDRSTGLTAGTGVTLKIGGALLTPGLAQSLATVSNMLIYIKSGTYNLTTATPGAGGPMLCASNIRVTTIGYETTRGDRTGTRPAISWASVGDPGSTTYMWATQGNAQQSLHNVELNGNSTANVSGVNLNSSSAGGIWDTVVKNCTGTSQVGFQCASGSAGATRCRAENCKIGFSGGQFLECIADACTNGFANNGSVPMRCAFCVATDSTGAGFSFSTTVYTYLAYCTSDGNTGDGFTCGSVQFSLIGCAATNNGGYGFNTPASQGILYSCASYNNTSGRTNGAPTLDQNPITLSGDPWFNASSDDFRPNNTSGAGASLRGAGLGVYGETDNRDVGAVQHPESRRAYYQLGLV